jgi:cyclase
VKIPVIASGGAGNPEHLFEVLSDDRADAVLIASMTHFRTYSIKEIKTYLHNKGIKVRMNW